MCTRNLTSASCEYMNGGMAAHMLAMIRDTLAARAIYLCSFFFRAKTQKGEGYELLCRPGLTRASVHGGKLCGIRIREECIAKQFGMYAQYPSKYAIHGPKYGRGSVWVPSGFQRGSVWVPRVKCGFRFIFTPCFVGVPLRPSSPFIILIREK